MMYRNLLEPRAFAELFALHPPQGFVAEPSQDGLPLFRAPLDLTTTLERAARQTLASLPGQALIRRALTWETRFVGTTLTEYAPVPRALSASALIDSLVSLPDAPTLTIIKDVPCASPLLTDEDNAFADELAAAASRAGFLALEGQALAYVPVDADSTEAYLARLSRARRKNLRRKLRLRDELTITTAPLGDSRFADEAFLGALYAMYHAVYEQSELHFDLLTPAFFAALLQHKALEGLVVFYYWHDTLVGYNICLVQNGALVDKYVGFVYPLARECHLYFISWLINLEIARERGLHTYIAGWTDPEVKASLGAHFTLTRHLIWVRNPLLRRALAPLRHLFEADAKALAARERP